MEDGLTLLVLAGGESERMGRSKALLKVDGREMIRYVIDRLTPLTSDLIISCKAGRERLEGIYPGARIAVDKSERDGPLVGLMSSLPLVENEYVGVVPCDSPKVRKELIVSLLNRARNNSAAIPRWPNGYIEPLVAVYRAEELEKAVNSVWERGEMKLSKVIERLEDVVFVPTDELKEVDKGLESFVNVNTPEDFEKHLL